MQPEEQQKKAEAYWMALIENFSIRLTHGKISFGAGKCCFVTFQERKKQVKASRWAFA